MSESALCASEKHPRQHRVLKDKTWIIFRGTSYPVSPAQMDALASVGPRVWAGLTTWDEQVLSILNIQGELF